MRFASICLGLLLAVAASAPAQAATVQDGDTFCESKRQLTNPGFCDLGRRDLGQTASSTPITFLGEGILYGWVRDARGPGSSFRDQANIVLTQDSLVSFKLLFPHKDFAGTLTIGDAVGPTLFGVGGIYELAPIRLAAGSYLFTFDAANPNEQKRNETEYKLYVAPIPLPAAGLLMLGGLAAFGAMRRRKAKA